MDRYSWTYFKLQRQFKKQGYKQVTRQQLREYVEQFLWKRHRPDTFVLQKDIILSVTPNQFFDYQTLLIKKQTAIGLDQIDLFHLD